MSHSPQDDSAVPPTSGTNPAAAKKAGRTRTLTLMLLVAVVGLLAWGTYYWVVGRFLEDTEDAYVKADSVTISPKVGGYVEEVFVTDNQMVKKGTPLVRLDRRQYQAVLDKASASIANLHAELERVQAQKEQQEAQLSQVQAQQQAAQIAAQHATTEWSRYVPLVATGASTAEQLAQLKSSRDQAVAQLHGNDAAVKSAQGRILETKAQVDSLHAQLDGAEADLRHYKLDLDDTILRSTLDGKVGDRGVRVGQLVQPGTRLMTIVPVDHLYIEANFKETQIGHMRVGQPVHLSIDALSDVPLTGTVESFAPGTGSEFALLPPENATGNFTKIVQRVPVKIRFNRHDLPSATVPGLSVRVEVDTRGAGEHHD